ncbi:DUF1599 domain-containing protein [Actinobacteria bacterium YIM 96077]|uniref:Nucleotide modification associated domain-containing protein n=1 Tax=Phytoactinopolyspora halophila TaxID=1981511 RepID=A0A329QHD3_9ACTN|nr:nucleotide modification associated domain-containing protein [Phytoactinopolyspora halophila]AYY11593.1 DUF1599 domain-containing protein [Actinobacteria bacterium YIM 96077]RAW11139.1 hypothetical protein DPM12_17510 [Phytoactinopolyspora halophila]
MRVMFPDGGYVDVEEDWLSPLTREDLQRLLQKDQSEMVEKFHEDRLENDTFKTFEEARQLLLRKHQDYGAKNISESPGGPLNGLRVRMWDKQARINNLVDSNAGPTNESLRDSFLDMLNYSAIALMVLDGRWPDE